MNKELLKRLLSSLVLISVIIILIIKNFIKDVFDVNQFKFFQSLQLEGNITATVCGNLKRNYNIIPKVSAASFPNSACFASMFADCGTCPQCRELFCQANRQKSLPWLRHRVL